MERRKFAEGVIVRVKSNLTKSYAEFGKSSGNQMENMKRKTFPIVRVSGPYGVKLRSPDKDFNFTFHIDDVEIYDDKIKMKYPKPEVFNPKNLFI